MKNGSTENIVRNDRYHYRFRFENCSIEFFLFDRRKFSYDSFYGTITRIEVAGEPILKMGTRLMRLQLPVWPNYATKNDEATTENCYTIADDGFCKLSI